MQVGLPIAPSSFTTTIVDPIITPFDNTAYTSKSSQRLYEDIIYSAKTNIYPLATYLWNDVSNQSTPEVIKLSDKTTITPTSVPCTKDVTVIYVEDTWKTGREDVVNKYFLYTGTTGNVDFTTIDPQSPANFTEINNYRNYDVIPSENSIYWDTIETINSKKHLDGTIYSQTQLETTGTITNIYTVNTSIDTVFFFNMDLTELAVTVTDLDDNILVERYIIDLRDYRGITTPWQWFFTPVFGINKENAFTKIPPYSAMKIIAEYTNTGNTPKIGETVFARMIDIGTAENAPQGRKKKFDTIEINKDGKKYKISRPAIIDEISYNVWVDTGRNDSVITQLGKLINENIVVIGDDTGSIINAIHYGWISEHPYELDTASTKNKYNMKITTLA